MAMLGEGKVIQCQNSPLFENVAVYTVIKKIQPYAEEIETISPAETVFQKLSGRRVVLRFRRGRNLRLFLLFSGKADLTPFPQEPEERPQGKSNHNKDKPFERCDPFGKC